MGHPPTLFTYIGTAQEVITISLRSVSDFDHPLNNPVLEIWDIDGKRIAYNDDFGDKNARLADIRLPADGAYTIRADTYGGIYAGDFEILLVQSDPFRRAIDGDTITFHLPAQHVFTHTLKLQAGTLLSITARDVSGGLDPLLWLSDATGLVIASNDDHASADLTLNILDAHLQVRIAQTGDYVVHIRDFLGRTGQMAVMIVVE